MLINHTTGEITYHSLILKESGGFEFKQKSLKNKKGKVEIVSSKQLQAKYLSFESPLPNP